VLLRDADGNVTRAADRAGVNRRFLQRMMARLRIRSGAGNEGVDEPDASEDEPDKDA
jgi:hypothetical protein